ncbi:alpha/beta hydrolase [Janibacter melonis]|uniref:Alpha/beta hydrolase n=1 Tax=Janibacter melonis TaxID=262209 RepID=A0A5P8FL77_9MICO|nr:alpha/beta fold hydrolase [Janibacter melonis]MCB5990319.1 alpha/beta hydrolase [Janibacter melonis]QFQ30296.2 alpha/beta hydrolase [Janibacter melonis]
MSPSTTTRRAATYGGAAVGGALAGAGSVWLGAAAYFARRVLTPDPYRPDDARIRVLHHDSVTLDATPETTVPGLYGLWVDGDGGHVRVGEVLEHDHRLQRVRRRLVSVDWGTARPGPVRVNGYYYARNPREDLGLHHEDVVVDGEVGPMPAWVVPSEGADHSRWAVLVHGRGARRYETLRAVPALHAAGLDVLVPSYRNDTEAPLGPDGRYNLGLSEWRDVEAAMRLAVARGAQEIVLVGWSMGGAIVLQVLDRSELAPLVSRAVLDGPVVDWADVLAHHARLHSVPRAVGSLGRSLMGQRWARGLVGLTESVDVTRTDWVRRADELHHPLLLIHSRDDEFVPVGPSERLAAARPDLVTFEPWSLARHCKEWNVDPHRWDRVVGDFVR